MHLASCAADSVVSVSVWAEKRLELRFEVEHSSLGAVALKHSSSAAPISSQAMPD